MTLSFLPRFPIVREASKIFGKYFVNLPSKLLDLPTQVFSIARIEDELYFTHATE